jgi:predicted lipid-binding transport protein (Tim44 family)
MSTPKFGFRKGFVALGLAALLALAPAVAEAKAGSGGSLGSRGARTQMAPPTTSTAPRTASPFERSATPQAQPGFNRPAAPAAQTGGFFGGALGKGLLGGLLGAGLIGMLMGHGFMGGLGGLMSMLGLLVQVALIGFLAMLAFRWWTNRNQSQRPAMAGAAPFGAPRSVFGNEAETQRPAGFGFGGGAAPAPVQTRPLTLQETDFPAFERKLADVQAAYSEEDVERLRRLATDEMVGYFAEDFTENQRKGVISKSSGTHLLQGDLSEAWNEGADDYATVAMRFSLVDILQDRATGRVVSGDPTQPVEVTEIWTFRRPAGSGPDGWKLSAIQQTS